MTNMRPILSLLLLLLMLSLTARRLRAQEAEVSDEDEEDEDSTPAEAGNGQPSPERPSKSVFKPPRVPDGAYYAQYFKGPGDLTEQLVVSQSKKDGVANDLAKYDGVWSVEVPASSAIEGDFALVLKSRARHHAVSGRLTRPFAFDDAGKQFVMQYEVKFQSGMECGGAYVKLLTEGPQLDQKNFNDRTPYTIMFGPDKCGMDHKLHFILRHRNPKTGQAEEKHAKKPKGDLDAYFSDKRTHLYTLVLNSDNSFEVYVDRALVNSGSLLEDMQPPVNPPKEVDDPAEKKPDDWDEREKIPDPKASKPADWDEAQPELVEDAEATMPQGWLVDERLTVPDPKAEKPKDWDDDMDGSWEPAQVDNPKCKGAPGCGPWSRPKVKNPLYKGKWSPPLVSNPAYKGAWKARKVPNPDYFEDSQPWRFDPIGAVGLELWSMSDGVAFDNLLIVDGKQLADAFAEQTWQLKREAERLADTSSQSVVDAIRDATRDRPWIWAALLVGVALPIVLVIAYCCVRDTSGRDRSAADEAADARRKKTDEEEELPAGEGKAGLEGEEEGEAEASDDEPPELVDLDAGDDGGGATASAEPGVSGSGQSTARKRTTRKE